MTVPAAEINPVAYMLTVFRLPPVRLPVALTFPAMLTAVFEKTATLPTPRIPIAALPFMLLKPIVLLPEAMLVTVTLPVLVI